MGCAASSQQPREVTITGKEPTKTIKGGPSTKYMDLKKRPEASLRETAGGASRRFSSPDVAFQCQSPGVATLDDLGSLSDPQLEKKKIAFDVPQRSPARPKPRHAGTCSSSAGKPALEILPRRSRRSRR